jgi:hypothetical protein
MALPANLTFKTVTGTFLRPDGTPFASYGLGTAFVFFTPVYEASNVAWLRDPTATTPTIVVPSPRGINLDVNGQFTTSLPASDSAAFNPRGWQYLVTARAGPYATSIFRMSLLAAGPATVDISTVIPL